MTDRERLIEKLDNHLEAIAEVCIPKGTTLESDANQDQKITGFTMTIREWRILRDCLKTYHNERR